jgi:hypothetical protein
LESSWSRLRATAWHHIEECEGSTIAVAFAWDGGEVAEERAEAVDIRSALTAPDEASASMPAY